MEKERLFDALQVIKEMCQSQDRCSKCPLEINGDCGLSDMSPRSWSILRDKEFQAIL